VLERESTAPALQLPALAPSCPLLSLCVYAMIVPGGPGEVVVGDHDCLGGARGARRVDQRARVAGALGCSVTQTHTTQAQENGLRHRAG
jgi:hypothetical protein